MSFWLRLLGKCHDTDRLLELVPMGMGTKPTRLAPLLGRLAKRYSVDADHSLLSAHNVGGISPSCQTRAFQLRQRTDMSGTLLCVAEHPTMVLPPPPHSSSHPRRKWNVAQDPFLIGGQQRLSH